MKLAIVRQKYTPFGGAERFVERALSALSDVNVDVSIVARHWSGHHNVIPCDPPYLGRTWRDLSFARAACRIIEDNQFDLVQSHERIPCCDIYRAGDGVHRGWMERRSRILGPAHRALYWATPFNRYTLRAEQRLYSSKKLKAVICISQLVKREIEKYFDIPPDRLHVIYNGVDLNKFNLRSRAYRDQVRESLKIPISDPLFLFVGSGYERKGLERALKALPEGAWLVVIGKDKYANKYRNFAEGLGIKNRVLFLGPREDVIPYYGAADAFVFPTLYEPFGNVILEAMACGLPVITTPDCGGADLIRHGNNGFVLNGEDIDAWRDVLESLCNVSKTYQIGQMATETAQDYGLQNMVAQMTKLYSRLI
jgi:UDP-glucose:(heptosyl)LPS alpha-1,3-glucosyltransferase